MILPCVIVNHRILIFQSFVRPNLRFIIGYWILHGNRTSSSYSIRNFFSISFLFYPVPWLYQFPSTPKLLTLGNSNLYLQSFFWVRKYKVVGTIDQILQDFLNPWLLKSIGTESGFVFCRFDPTLTQIFLRKTHTSLWDDKLLRNYECCWMII